MSNTPRPEHEPDPDPDFSTFLSPEDSGEHIVPGASEKPVEELGSEDDIIEPQSRGGPASAGQESDWQDLTIEPGTRAETLPPEDSGEYIVPGASEKPVEELGSEDDIIEPQSRGGPASAEPEFDWEDVTIEPGTRAGTSSGLEEDTIEPGTRGETSSAEPETGLGEDIPEAETGVEEEVPPIKPPSTPPKPPAAKWPWIGMAATLLVGVAVGGVGSGLFSPQTTNGAKEKTSSQTTNGAEVKTSPQTTNGAEVKTTAPVTPKDEGTGKALEPPTASVVLTHLDAIDQALSDPGTYKKGLELARKGVDLAQATGDPATQLEAYLLLSQAQEANGDYDAALKTIAEGSKIQGQDEKSGTAKTLRGRLKSAERRILRSKKSSRAGTGAGTGGTATAPGAKPRGMETGLQRKLSIGLGVRILVALQANQPARLVDLQSNLKDVQQEVERERVPDSLLNLAVANREIGAYFQDQSDEQAIKYLEDAAQNCVDGLRRFPGIERDEFIRNELRKELGTVVGLLRTASDTLARRFHESETKNGKVTADNAALSMQVTEARASLKRAEDRIAAMNQPVPPAPNPVAAGPDPKKLQAQIEKLLAQVHELELKLNSAQVEARQAKDAVVAANRRTEKLGQGEKQWAGFAQGLAGLAGFPTAMPDENSRWKLDPPETDAETLGWMQGLQAAIRTKVEPTDRLAYGDQSWAKFARRVAQKVGYGAPLPEVRWARTPDRATEEWEDRLAIFVPSVPPVPTTPAAERDFNKGYEDYFHCEYAQAIARFDAAIAKVPSDARFYYFRGLARLGDHQSGGTSKREDGIEDLRQGIILERRGTPSPQQVSQVLVRIQGDLRQWVEAFRATGELPPGAVPRSPPCLPRIPSATMTLAPGRFQGIPTIAPGCVPGVKAL